MENKYLKRLVSILITLSMIFGLMLPISAAWDGYTPPNGETLVKLVDINRANEVFISGLLPSPIATYDDRYSLNWKTKNKGSIAFYNVPNDWTSYNEIKFSIYTEKPGKGTFTLAIYTELPEDQSVTVSYYAVSGISTTHTGWKEFVFKKEDFTEKNATGWDKIRKVVFNAATKEEDGDYCFSSIFGETAETDPKLKLDASESGRKSVYETLGANTAIMNYSNNVIKNGEIIPVKNVNDRITTDKSGTIAKFGLFTNVLGGELKDEDGKVTITLDGVTKDVTEFLVTYDDGKYLKVNPTLEALGKTVKTKDMVTIIGEEERTDKIFDDPVLLDDLKFMLNVSVLTQEDITKEDWELIRKRWRDYLVGPPQENPTPEMLDKIKALDKEYETYRDSINKDPNVAAMFGKSSYTTWNSILSDYTKIKKMAKAYATYGSKYYKNPEARRVILELLEWGYQNEYGIDELLGNFKLPVPSGGLWNFLIGVPTELAETVLLLDKDISRELAEKYLEIYERSKYSASTQAAGRLYAATLTAAIFEDYDEMLARNSDYVQYMKANNYDVDKVLRLGANSAVKEDWLYLTHKYFAYSAAYGCTTLLDRIVNTESILMGTQFEFVNPYKYDPIMWLKETFSPIMFNGAITSAQSARFRAVDMFSETTYIWYPIAAALDLLGCFGKDDDEWLKQFIKRNVVKENRKSIESNLNSYQLEKLNLVMNDETIETEPYYNSKVYYTGDSVVHQKGNFGFAISMSSSRISKWESIAQQNVTGWYQGDGMLFTYIQDDVEQYARNYWKHVNPYHLPGTTVDTQERTPASITAGPMLRTEQHFVGGVQFDKDFSVAAMQLEGHKNNNPNAAPSATKQGDAPHFISNLMAKKAWFLFDDEAVAVGADIDSNDGFEVETIIENRKLKKNEKIQKPSTTSKDGVVEYEIIFADATDETDGNPPVNTYDNDLVTFWSAPNDANITWEIEEVSPIGFVCIAQRNGTEGKQAIFELELSTDGKTWTQVWAGKASGQTIELEAYDVGGKPAKYIRYVGHGRTNSVNNVLTEVKIFAPTADGSSPLKNINLNEKPNPEDSNIMGAEKITIDGTLLEKASSYEKEFKDPKWAHIEGTGGYFFPMGGDVKVHKFTNTINFFEMWFSHGVSPKDQTYAYVVLPTKTAEETEAYTKNPDIEILSNNEKVQVVREKTLGMTGLVFWEASKFDAIEVSVPMIMMTKDKDAEGKYRINLSDPTKLLAEGKVTLKGNYELVEGDKRFTVTQKNGETVISIDFKGAEGRTLPITLLAK